MATEMPSENIALQFCSTALLTSLHFPDEGKIYLNFQIDPQISRYPDRYPEISNDIEQHERNPCQSALDFDHNELPEEHNSAKQNLDME